MTPLHNREVQKWSGVSGSAGQNLPTEHPVAAARLGSGCHGGSCWTWMNLHQSWQTKGWLRCIDSSPVHPTPLEGARQVTRGGYDV